MLTTSCSLPLHNARYSNLLEDTGNLTPQREQDMSDYEIMALHTACTKGDIASVKRLLKGGVDVNVRICGDTPLHQACYWGQAECVKELLQAGASIHILNHEQVSPLESACRKGHAECCKAIMRHTKHGDILDGIMDRVVSIALEQNTFEMFGLLDRYNPVCAAICAKSPKLFQLVLEVGADVNICDGVYDCPLHLACRNDQIECVRTLLQVKDINVNRHLFYEDSALNIASRKVRKLLLSVPGIDRNPADTRRRLTRALEEGRDKFASIVRGSGHDFNTILHTAVEMGDTFLVDLFLRAGVDVNYLNFSGQTPLHLACCKASLAIVQRLLRAPGINVNIREYNTRKDTGNTALHNAAMCQSSDIARCLLEAGCDVDSRGEYQRTPLHYAAESDTPTVHVLIAAGADVNAEDQEHVTPLHNCVKTTLPSVEAWVALIEAGAAFSVQNDSQLIKLVIVYNDCDKYPYTFALEHVKLAVGGPISRRVLRYYTDTKLNDPTQNWSLQELGRLLCAIGLTHPNMDSLTRCGLKDDYLGFALCLKARARQCIRRHLASCQANICYGLKQLPLPARLRDYLLLEIL